MHFTYILNIDIAIFGKYRINIVSKLKKVMSKHLYSERPVCLQFKEPTDGQGRI